MKIPKTKAADRQIGKKCNCFYKGKIYACEVVGFAACNTYTQCSIPELSTTLNIRTTHVNWTDDPQVEEAWLDEYEAKRDRTERQREAREAMRQTVKDRISESRTERTDEEQDVRKRWSSIEPKVLKALSVRMKSLCGVGSCAVSQLLNLLDKNGEPSAKLIRTALEIEKFTLMCYRYNGRPVSCYHWSKRKELCVELMERCREEGIPFGHPEGNREVVCVWIPGCEVLVLPVKEWLVDAGMTPRFPHPWDGKTRMNLRKLEDAVNGRYGWYLRMKYPERFA